MISMKDSLHMLPVLCTSRKHDKKHKNVQMPKFEILYKNISNNKWLNFVIQSAVKGK